jgi:CelD/BcsL family acetyltransferase involved in cellulose biosynthesis
MGDYRISVIDSFDQWEMLRTEWNDLLAKSATPNLFQTWEWLYSWAEVFLGDKRDLFIVVVYEENELVGIAPWYINHVRRGLFSIRQIEFLGTPDAGSDYLDVLIKKGKEKEVSGNLYNFLFSNSVAQWDRLRLYDIPSNSLFLLHLLTKIKENGKYVSIEDASFCPIAVLPGTEDEFFAGLSSNRRQSFRRHLKTLYKQDAAEHTTISSKNLGTALQDFFALYTEKTGRPGDDLHRFVDRLAAKGVGIQIDFISVGSAYIGGLLHLRYGETLYMYLMAVDKKYSSKVSLGNVLVGICIGNAIRSGIRYYDFLKGIEDYKFSWANFGRSSNSVLLSQRSPIPVCLTLGDIIKSAAKLVLR